MLSSPPQLPLQICFLARVPSRCNVFVSGSGLTPQPYRTSSLSQLQHEYHCPIAQNSKLRHVTWAVFEWKGTRMRMLPGHWKLEIVCKHHPVHSKPHSSRGERVIVPHRGSNTSSALHSLNRYIPAGCSLPRNKTLTARDI